MKNIYEKDMYACLIFALLFFANAIFCLFEKDMLALVISSVLCTVFLITSLRFAFKN